MKAYLTTVDNPYNPKTEFDDWLAYDMRMGYNSCGYLDKIMYDSEEYTKKLSDEAKEIAIDEIVRFNPEQYKKLIL